MYMENKLLQEGSRIQVTMRGPFRGLSGKILMVDAIPADREDPFCFYLIALEGAHIKKPLWFLDDEIEFVAEPLPHPSASGHVKNI
jgi:hypothetical protein